MTKSDNFGLEFGVGTLYSITNIHSPYAVFPYRNIHVALPRKIMVFNKLLP